MEIGREAMAELDQDSEKLCSAGSDLSARSDLSAAALVADLVSLLQSAEGPSRDLVSLRGDQLQGGEGHPDLLVLLAVHSRRVQF